MSDESEFDIGAMLMRRFNERNSMARVDPQGNSLTYPPTDVYRGKAALTYYNEEGERVNEQYAEFRAALAKAIEDEFRNLINHNDKKVQVKTWLTEDRQGPMGGTSSQVTAAVDIDGTVFPVAINIYCDRNIALHVERLVEEEEENQRLRSKLGFVDQLTES